MTKTLSNDILHFLATVWIPILEVIVGVIIGPWVKRIIVRLSRKSANQGLMTFIGSAANLTIIAISLIMAAEGVGVKMNSVIALISALGLGVALALKGNMANVAGGIQILVTKPFNVNDYIKIGDHRGVVTAIELMFITIRTDNGKEIVIPNSTIVEDMIVNYSKNPALRLKVPFQMPVGMDYELVRKQALALMEDNPYFLKDKPVDVLVTSMSTSGVMMKVIGFVQVSQMEACRHLVYQELSRGLPYYQHGSTSTEVVHLVNDLPKASSSSSTTTTPNEAALPDLPKPASVEAAIPQPVPVVKKVQDFEEKIKEDLNLPLEPLLHPIKTLEDKFHEHELEQANTSSLQPQENTNADGFAGQNTASSDSPNPSGTTNAIPSIPVNASLVYPQPETGQEDLSNGKTSQAGPNLPASSFAGDSASPSLPKANSNQASTNQAAEPVSNQKSGQ